MKLFGKIVTLKILSAATDVTHIITDKVLRKSEQKEKNDYIIVGKNLKKLIGENYKDVKKSLEAYGFTNVSFVVRRDLKTNLREGLFFREVNDYEDGEVEEISINGKVKFSADDKFLPTAKVAIVYHTYKGTKIDEDEGKIIARCSSCNATIEYSAQIPQCPYCGNPIEK